MRELIHLFVMGAQAGGRCASVYPGGSAQGLNSLPPDQRGQSKRLPVIRGICAVCILLHMAHSLLQKRPSDACAARAVGEPSAQAWWAMAGTAAWL